MILNKVFIVSLSLFCFLSLHGCRQSFPKENFEQHVSEAFVKEFNLKVTPTLVNKTLCIRIPVDQQIIPKDGGFDPKLRQIVEDAMILSFRVVLSTDADVDFYKIIIFNKETPGICFNITRYTLDTKRFMLGDISRGDYSDRMEMGVFFDPVSLGTNLIKNFIQDAEKNDSSFLIQKYFPSFVSLNKIEPTLFRFFIEHDSKKGRSLQITQLKTLSLSAQTALLYCRFKQSFTSLNNSSKTNQKSELIFKNNDEIELIFKISSALYPRAIDSIYSLSVLENDGTLFYQGVPQELGPYRDLSAWSMDLWDKKRAIENLPQFLSRQISTMITSSFSKNEKLSRQFIPTDILGFYKKTPHQEGEFHFSLNVIPRKSPESLSLKDTYHLELIQHALNIIGQILIKKYQFKDYEAVFIEYPLKNEVLEINKEELKKFIKKRISFEELIQMKQTSTQLSSSLSSY